MVFLGCCWYWDFHFFPFQYYSTTNFCWANAKHKIEGNWKFILLQKMKLFFYFILYFFLSWSSMHLFIISSIDFGGGFAFVAQDELSVPFNFMFGVCSAKVSCWIILKWKRRNNLKSQYQQHPRNTIFH